MPDNPSIALESNGGKLGMEVAGMGVLSPLAIAATSASVCSRCESICRWKSLISSPSSAMRG